MSGLDNSPSTTSSLAALASPGNLLEMQILKPHPNPSAWEIPGKESSNPHFNKHSRWLWHTLKFENHCDVIPRAEEGLNLAADYLNNSHNSKDLSKIKSLLKEKKDQRSIRLLSKPLLCLPPYLIVLYFGFFCIFSQLPLYPPISLSHCWCTRCSLALSGLQFLWPFFSVGPLLINS